MSDQTSSVHHADSLLADTRSIIRAEMAEISTEPEELTVRLYDKIKDRTYQFDIPKGYCFDGASIPKFFQRIIGAPTDNSFLIAALVHDQLCENHHYIMNDREFSTEVFNVLLESSKVGKFKRFLMKHSVNTFQKFFCDWGLEWTS